MLNCLELSIQEVRLALFDMTLKLKNLVHLSAEVCRDRADLLERLSARAQENQLRTYLLKPSIHMIERFNHTLNSDFDVMHASALNSNSIGEGGLIGMKEPCLIVLQHEEVNDVVLYCLKYDQ